MAHGVVCYIHFCCRHIISSMIFVYVLSHADQFICPTIPFKNILRRLQIAQISCLLKICGRAQSLRSFSGLFC